MTSPRDWVFAYVPRRDLSQNPEVAAILALEGVIERKVNLGFSNRLRAQMGDMEKQEKQPYTDQDYKAFKERCRKNFFTPDIEDNKIEEMKRQRLKRQQLVKAHSDAEKERFKGKMERQHSVQLLSNLDRKGGLNNREEFIRNT